MPTDPTRSQTKRERVQREFRSRWRDVRGATRRELTGGSYYRPQNDRSIGRQTSAFREYLEGEIDRTVIEPAYSRTQVERGQHWTGRIVREFYEHGIRLAHSHLKAAGASHPSLDVAPDAILRRDTRRFGGEGVHEEFLVENYDEFYTDLVDVGRETAKQAYREYRDAARSGATVNETLSRVNDRLDKVGGTRTDLVARTKLIQTINDAVVARYSQLGVPEVGVDVEAPDEPAEAPVATDGGTATQQASAAQGANHAHVEQHRVTDESEGGHVRQVYETAGDRKVCPECAFYDGQVFTVAELVAGVVPTPPIHPNCRCVFRVYDTSDLGWA